MLSNIILQLLLLICTSGVITPTNKVKSRVQELPYQDGSGNRPDKGNTQPTVNVCQDRRFGRGHTDGKVGC